MLKAQADELEDQLWQYMDPTSVVVEGSKATKAYWLERVRVLEEELAIAQGPWPMQDADRPSGGRSGVGGSTSASQSSRITDPDGGNEGQRKDPTSEGLDRSAGRLSDLIQPLLGRPGDQRGPELDLPAPDLQVETASVDVEDPPSRGDGNGRSVPMASEPQVADDDAGETTGVYVGTHGSGTAAMQRSPPECHDEGRSDPHSEGKKPSRGLVQKMKKGVSNGQRALSLLTLTAAIPLRWHVLEVFPTSAPWHRHDAPIPWQCSGPLWEQPYPPTEKQCLKLMAKVRQAMPDLVIFVPMCGPWSSWTQEKGRALRERQRKYLPMWELLEALWRYQVENRRLILVMVPAKVICPGTDELRILGASGYLCPEGPRDPTVPQEHDSEGCLLPVGGCHGDEQSELGLDPSPEERRDPTVPREHDSEGCPVPVGGRDPVYDSRVDWCQFGALDPQSLKPYKKAMKVEANDPLFCSQLSIQGQSQHAPGSHEPIEGVCIQENGLARKVDVESTCCCSGCIGAEAQWTSRCKPQPTRALFRPNTLGDGAR